MPRYVDSFVLAVPKENFEAYRELATRCGAIWKEHGALQYIECVADDVPDGRRTSFPLAVKRKRGEVVVQSWIVFESREHRDGVNEAVMKDPRMADMNPETMPFDAKRMIFGGFSSFIEM